MYEPKNTDDYVVVNGEKIYVSQYKDKLQLDLEDIKSLTEVDRLEKLPPLNSLTLGYPLENLKGLENIQVLDDLTIDAAQITTLDNISHLSI